MSLLLFLRGIAIGLADVVPGVSGGTIAFITGIYERLIEALSTFNFKKPLKNDWALFVPLALGVGVAFLLGARLIDFLLDAYPSPLFAFFFGLILASAVVIFRHIRKVRFEHFVFAAVGLVFALVLSSFSSVSSNHSYPMLLISGMVAICATLLPGISGSFVLLLLGQYETVIKAVHTFDFVIIGTVGIGALVGLLLFSKFLSWLFKKYKGLTIATLIGIMVGSLKIPLQKMDGNVLSFVFVVVGFVLVYALEIWFTKR